MKLEIVGLDKSFGENHVLRGLDVSAESGVGVGLLGRNGAGKTTTIRILMGVLLQDGGQVLVDGAPIDRRKLRIGYLPEERGLYPKKPVMDQLIYFGELKGMSRRDARSSAGRLLERMDMGGYRSKRLDTLSKGNQQKIQLAAALISEPEIVVLDEPFSGLDPVNAMLLKDIVSELIAGGRVVFLSSHQMNYIEELCQNIAILRDGVIAVSGNIRELKRGYDRRRMLVSTPEPERAAAALGVPCSLEEGDLVVELRREEDRPELFAKLAGLGMLVDGVRVAEPSLSDIFIQYAEGGRK